MKIVFLINSHTFLHEKKKEIFKMNFKKSSLLTLFFFLICLVTITTSDLQKIKVISPANGEVIPHGGSISVKYETTKPDEGETCSLHVLLLNGDKYQLYQIVADQNLDGKPHEYSVPWSRLQRYTSFYIRFHENYKPANSNAVQRLVTDIYVQIAAK